MDSSHDRKSNENKPEIIFLNPEELDQFQEKFQELWFGIHSLDPFVADQKRNELAQFLLGFQKKPDDPYGINPLILAQILFFKYEKKHEMISATLISGFLALFDAFPAGNRLVVENVLKIAFQNVEFRAQLKKELFRSTPHGHDYKMSLAADSYGYHPFVTIANKFGFEMVDFILENTGLNTTDSYDMLLERYHRSMNFYDKRGDTRIFTPLNNTEYMKLLQKCSPDVVVRTLISTRPGENYNYGRPHACKFNAWIELINKPVLDLCIARLGIFRFIEMLGEVYDNNRKVNKETSIIENFLVSDPDSFIDRLYLGNGINRSQLREMLALARPLDYLRTKPDELLEIVKKYLGQLKHQQFANKDPDVFFALRLILNILNEINTKKINIPEVQLDQLRDQFSAMYGELLYRFFVTADEKKYDRTQTYDQAMELFGKVNPENLPADLNFFIYHLFLRMNPTKELAEKNPIKLQLKAFKHLHAAATANPPHPEALELLRSLISQESNGLTPKQIELVNNLKDALTKIKLFLDQKKLKGPLVTLVAKITLALESLNSLNFYNVNQQKILNELNNIFVLLREIKQNYDDLKALKFSYKDLNQFYEELDRHYFSYKTLGFSYKALDQLFRDLDPCFNNLENYLKNPKGEKAADVKNTAPPVTQEIKADAKSMSLDSDDMVARSSDSTSEEKLLRLTKAAYYDAWERDDKLLGIDHLGDKYSPFKVDPWNQKDEELFQQFIQKMQADLSYQVVEEKLSNLKQNAVELQRLINESKTLPNNFPERNEVISIVNNIIESLDRLGIKRPVEDAKGILVREINFIGTGQDNPVVEMKHIGDLIMKLKSNMQAFHKVQGEIPGCERLLKNLEEHAAHLNLYLQQFGPLKASQTKTSLFQPPTTQIDLFLKKLDQIILPYYSEIKQLKIQIKELDEKKMPDRELKLARLDGKLRWLQKKVSLIEQIHQGIEMAKLQRIMGDEGSDHSLKEILKVALYNFGESKTNAAEESNQVLKLLREIDDYFFTPPSIPPRPSPKNE